MALKMESKFLNANDKVLHCMWSDFYYSFYFPTIPRFMLCYSNPESYRVSNSYQTILDLHVCGHAILPISLLSPILPDSLLLILRLVEASGLDQKLT